MPVELSTILLGGKAAKNSFPAETPNDCVCVPNDCPGGKALACVSLTTQLCAIEIIECKRRMKPIAQGATHAHKLSSSYGQSVRWNVRASVFHGLSTEPNSGEVSTGAPNSQ